MNPTTLNSVFESHKTDLANKLNGLSLPKDANEVQEIVSSFLGNLFENDGVYRQNLTQSEDYILQAVFQLLQTQQVMAKEIVSANSNARTDTSHDENHKSGYLPLIGAGIGAAAGTLLGTWGAVCGAIAGTAVTIYCSYKSNPQKAQTEKSIAATININTFTSIVAKICANIDALMETYRIQVKRIANIYEQREKPSLTSDYSTLLEQIVNVYNICSSSEDVPTKLKNAVEMLAESLENYNLKIENGKIISE